MSVHIFDRQQTPGSGVGLSAVAAGDNDVAAGQDRTQQVTDGTVTATTPASCGQELITTYTDYEAQSSSSSRQEAPPPQSRLSSSCIGPAAAGEDTRAAFDKRRRRRQQQHQEHQLLNGCDKNKQHDDSGVQDAFTTRQTPDSQGDLRGARQSDQNASCDVATRSTSLADPQMRFKLPNPIHETSTSPSRACERHLAQNNISGFATATMISATNNKPLGTTRHHSTIEMSNAPAANRMLVRKTSVFSHNGFMGLHKLDQSAIKQHAIVSAAAIAATGDISRDDAIAPQVDNSKDHSASKTTTTASSSPRQPYRSDTLGSTGSSRASSCDEPTIVSPAKLLAPTTPMKREHNLRENLITIPSSQDSNAPYVGLSHVGSLAVGIVAGHEQNDQGQNVEQQNKCIDDNESTIMQCDNQDDNNEMRNAYESVAKQTNSRKGQQQDSASDEEEDESDDEDEDEDDDEDDDDDDHQHHHDQNNKYNVSGERPPRVSLSTNFRESLKIPPFESIKTQIKKDSIPNAEDIKRHIEKLISRNEEIIDNWNQVSIRSYNSSSSSSGAAATAAAASTNRRTSKRWSTTALCTKGSGIMLDQLGASTSLGDHNGKPMSGIERKRSKMYHPIRGVSQLHKPLTIFNEPPMDQASVCPVQLRHSLAQTTTGAANPCPLQISHSMPSSPKQTVNLFSDVHHQQISPNYQHQTIESAIENLSLKKGHSEEGVFLNKSEHLAAATNGDSDLVMAALLVERQRQQQLLDEYLRQRASSDHRHHHHHHHHHQMYSPHEAHLAQPTPSLPNPILDHYQQQLTSQQQQQLIEYQLGLSRLAALENELLQQRQQERQAMADLMSAASFQNQQTLASLNCPQQVDQFNPQTAALENQLLNEYLAKIILSRQQENHQLKPQLLELASQSTVCSSPTGGDHLNGGRPIGPFQVSPTSPSRVYLGHGSELQTQSLDSATPSYRCDACDITFWTRDLLNYHSMTSCSARTGPRPNKPIAFSFDQPNGFDSTMTSTDSASQSASLHSSLQSPTVVVSCADTGATSSAAAKSFNHHHHHHHQAVSPARRRTYDELNAPSSPQMASYRDLLSRNQQQQHKQSPHERQLSTSSIDNRQIREQQQQQQTQLSHLDPSKSGALLAPKSPHRTRESAQLAWQQRLEELSILKQQLLLNGRADSTALVNLSTDQQQQQQQQHQQMQNVQQVTLSGNKNQESKLPIKKRKISEPNMKY